MSTPATTAVTLATATSNAGQMELANQQADRKGQAAPTSSALDVWTNTGGGLKEQFSSASSVLMNRTIAGSVVGAAKGLSGPWASSSFSAMAAAVGQQVDATGQAFGEIGKAKGALATTGAIFAALTSIEQTLSIALSWIPFPAFPAVRVLDMDIGLPHAHMHPPNLIPPAPPVPLPSTGPIIPIPFLSGANKTLINAMPAARCGDMGLGIWCGGYFPMYEIFLGSSSVWIEGNRAARVAVDITKHCMFSSPKPSDPPLGPMVGFTITSSANVLIGGIPMPSLTSMAMGAFFKGVIGGLKKVLGAAKSGLSKLGQKIDSLRRGCGHLGEPVDVVSGANVDDFIDFEQPSTELPFVWRRYYSSNFRDRVGSMGRGFRHEYERTLRRTRGSFEYVDQAGEVVEFPAFTPGSSEVSSDGLVLKRLDDGWYEIDSLHSATMRFQIRRGEAESPVHSIHRFDQLQELTYDDLGRLIGLSDSLGTRVRWEYSVAGEIVGVWMTPPPDANGQPNRERVIARYRYSAANELLEWIDALGHVARFEYDATHRITRKTDRRGYSYHYRYDDQGRCIHTWGDDGLYDLKLAYFPHLGMTEAVWADGAKSQYFYDSDGHLTEIVDPLGNSRKFTTNDVGNVVQDIDALGNVTELLYDQHGEHYERVDCHGYSSLPVHIQPLQDDPLQIQVPREPLQWEHGDTISSTTIRGDRLHDPVLRNFPVMLPMASQLAAQKVATPGETLDALGRVLRRDHGDGTHETWNYDPNGNVLLHRDRAGGAWESSYKSWNLLDVDTDPIGAQHKVEYNLREEVTSFVDPGGTKTDYVYDAKDRLVEVRRLGRVRERILYDAADNIVERQDGQGQMLAKYTIGPGNLDKAFELATGEKYLLDHDKRGRIVVAATDKYRIEREYNSFDRFLGEQRLGKGVKHEYGRRDLTKTTFFDNFAVEYRHVGNQTVIKDPTGREHFLRHSFDGLIDREFSNGSREMSQYDSQGRCVRKVVLGKHSSQTWVREFLYNGTGNLTATNDNIQGNTSYDYDLAGRLVASHLPDRSKKVFEYDAARNLTAQPGLFGVVICDGNQLRTANDDSFAYNDRDHLSERSGPNGTTRYTYNARDQLTHVVAPGLDWTAEYDPLGRRIKKSWNGNEVEFFWDEDRLAAEIHNQGRTRFYVYDAPGARVPFMFIEYDSPTADPKSGRCYFVIADQRGCPIRIEDASGKIAWQADVDPYGTAHVRSGATIEMPLRFPGHYFDAETGLHDNRYRSYSSELGRYLQSDPAGLGGGVNLYAYPSNPLTDVDLLGLHGLMNRIAKRISDLGAKAEQRWQKFLDGRKAAKSAGMKPKHLRNLEKHCKETGTMAVIRHTNPESLPHQGAGNARPKPLDVKLKTAKDGPNAGLVTKEANNLADPDMAKNLADLEKKGYKFDDDGVLRDPNGNAFHGDYDMQGMYDMKQTPPKSHDTNNPNYKENLNDTVCPESSDGQFQHGANDNYKKPDGTAGRTPGDDEKFLVVDEKGNSSTKTLDELHQLYDDKGIPWPY